MKQLVLSFVLLGMGTTLWSQVNLPAPSPTQTILQEFALGSIEIKYSRPQSKHRKVFGDLVPFNKIWRTGANAATLVKLTDRVEINGKNIDSGTYALYTVPGYDSWEIIFNKGIKNWGLEGYREADDVLRFRVAPFRLKEKIETFTIQFEDVKSTSCNLVIQWEKTGLKIPVTANIRERLRTQLTAALASDKKPYWQAAQFYNEYDKNPRKALEFIRKAVDENPKAYWIWLYKANLEKEAGDKKGALESSKKSLALARDAKNDDYVKLNEELQKKLQ